MRQPRIVLPGYPHHVTIRGNNRRRLFSYPDDYKRMLWDIGRALEVYEIVLEALVLMTNHVHLILVPTIEEALASFMKSFQQRYAQYRNKKRRSSGRLFEGRYFSAPIRNQAQLALTLAYVDLNPVRAGICDSPLEYPWSTYGHLAGGEDATKVPVEIVTPSDWYLGLGDDAAERARSYRDWVEHCRANERVPAHADGLSEFEALSAIQYTLRLERPDRTRAFEPTLDYPLGRKARLSSDAD